MRKILLLVMCFLLFAIGGCNFGTPMDFSEYDKKEEVAENLQDEVIRKLDGRKVIASLLLSNSSDMKIEVQNIDDPERIDLYEFRNGVWLEPHPIDLTLFGDKYASSDTKRMLLEKRAWNIENVRFSVLPKVRRDIEGFMKSEKLKEEDFERVYTINYKANRIWTSIKTDAERIIYYTDLNGDFVRVFREVK